jgi:hypothetical protein
VLQDAGVAVFGSPEPPAFATHRTRQLPPVTSGGAERLVAGINEVCKSYRDVMVEFDRQHKEWTRSPWFEEPARPTKDAWLQRLRELGVDPDSANRYLDGALKGRKI